MWAVLLLTEDMSKGTVSKIDRNQEYILLYDEIDRQKIKKGKTLYENTVSFKIIK